MAAIAPTLDDNLDDAAGHYSGTYNHKYDGAITEEPTNYNDDHSGIVARQSTEKTDEGLLKQSAGDPALEGSRTYRTGTAQDKYAGAIYNPGIGDDDDDDQSVVVVGHTAQKIQKQYGEPTNMNSALEGAGVYRTSTAQNKDAGAILNPGIGNNDDHDQLGVVGGHTAQKIQKPYREPTKIQKQYGEPAKKNPALKELIPADSI
jgi:hypothetical protein